ncbi:MAG: hypothetical protein ACI867_000924 [Glaciecola sp.]|jgi:uncharacterized protein (DUF58 family)
MCSRACLPRSNDVLTRRGWGLAGSAVALWITSRILGVPELSMLALAAAALVLLAAAFTAGASASITAHRHVTTPRLHHGRTGAVEVTLHNAGRLPTAILQVKDDAADLFSDANTFVLRPLAPGASAGLSYQVHGRRRGRWEFGPVQVWLRDPFGLFARPRPVAAGGHLTVFPPVVALPPGLPLAGHSGSGSTGKPRSLHQGEDLAMVREYQRGDDLRKVHWRSTAHRGALMMRQDESPQQSSATLVLDLRKDRHHGQGAASSLEYVVTAAASVAVHLATRSYSVTLLTEPVTTTPTPMNHELSLENLATVQAQTGDALGSIWQQLSTGLGATGTLVAILTLPNARELRTMVRAGRRFPSRTALLVDSGSFRRRAAEDATSTAAAVGALRAAGWRVGIQRAGEPLDGVWQELILQRTRGNG